MALRSRKPTSPGPPLPDGLGLRRAHARHARAQPARSEAEDRRPQRLRPQDLAPPRRRPQAAVPHRRLPSEQGRRAGQGRATSSTTRTAPVGSPCCTTSTARSATSSRRTASTVGDMVAVRPRRRHPRRQRPADALHPDRLGRPQRRAAPRRRRQDGAQRGHERPARRQGRRLRHAATALDRDAPRARSTAARRSASSATPSTSSSRSARPAATAGRACAPRRAASP